MTRFKESEKRFVTIIGQSPFRNPYHIQRLKPVIRINNIKTETCDAFFSFNILMTWGSMEAPVNIPAVIPTILTTAMLSKTIYFRSIYKKPALYKKARHCGLTLTPKPYCL
jgi:hypothetical protein